MASLAQSRPRVTQSSSRWIVGFLAQELKPYPGRSWTVVRMTISATLVMLWIMVDRVPGAALGAYYTLLFSRDSPQATVRSALTAVGAVACSLCVILFTAAILAGNPVLHFCWVIGMLFLIFFLISAVAEYPMGTAFGFLAVNSLTAWDFPANTELLVEGTLWTALAVALAACITVAVELISRRIHPFDQLKEGLTDRIQTVEAVLDAWGNHHELNEVSGSKLVQYAMTGTASMRRLLLRSNNNPQMMAELSATVALVGRLIDLSATLNDLEVALSPADRERCLEAVKNLQGVRIALSKSDFAAIAALQPHLADARNPFISDIERTIGLMPQVFSGLAPLSEYLPSAVDFQMRRNPIWKEDAFTNPDHVRFALKGALAAAFCYVLYSAIDWPGLSTAVSTCIITALSTVGSSRQKQVLRVIGALFGAICLGMSAQVFLLPHLDGIGGFTVLFVAVTAIASWVATSSPRLSYAGVQTAFAFYVTHLRTFGPQTSLAVARDDVAGILLGLAAMWLCFDQIWVKDSAVRILELFTANLRRIAEFDHQIVGLDLPAAIDKARAERGLINNQFDLVRNESDALFFEFGSRWRQKVKLRNQIRAWQPQLRTYFLLQLSLFHYRVQDPQLSISGEAKRWIEQSQNLLRMLADWKDPQGGQIAAKPPDDLLQFARTLNGQMQAEQHREQTSQRATGICSSMFKVALGVANAMITDSSSHESAPAAP
ncbi:MAG TPA: FUSC family protein [Bryobacteraceae bacterium]|nr:FUSC family protein [Bryobacteraceae bacterium]